MDGRNLLGGSLNDINDSLGELEVPFKDIETFVEPNEIEPLVDKVPIYFYMIEATGAVFPLHEVWLEDESGWITLYDEIQPWKYVRGKYKYLLIPKTGKNIGISIYPPIGFQAKDSLLFLFAFDVEF